ncbi:MAG: formyltransferase family protein [Pseudomonadota bacterium]
MIVDVLCSDPRHPVVPFLEAWVQKENAEHEAQLFFRLGDLRGGDVLFLVSCSEIVTPETRSRYRETMVLHASDLPNGRGWSPYVWELLAGAEQITMTLLRAEDPVDTGAIWAKRAVDIPKALLFDEISERLFMAEIDLMSHGLTLVSAGAVPEPQATDGATYWPKRQPTDSRIDPAKSLAMCFDQIRIADPHRYPAFFDLHGQRFYIELKKKPIRGRDEN